MSEVLENPAVIENLSDNSPEVTTRTAVIVPDVTNAGVAPEAAKAAYRQYLTTLHRDPSTVNRYATCLNRFFAFMSKKNLSDLRAVTRADITEYQAELSTSTWTIHTTHSHLRAVRRLYEFLENNGKILLNPAAGIRMPKLIRNLPRDVMTREEVRRILDEPDTSLPAGIRDRAIMEVFYSTGLRVAELCHLTVHDVDLRNGYLRINCGKGCKDRVTPLGKRAMEYLNEYVRHIRGNFTRKHREERALFVAEYRGHGLTTTRVNQIVRSYAKRAGIKKRVSPHVFRHTFATHLLEAGADISQVQRMMGHVMINTTQVYTRVAVPDVKRTHTKTHPREKDKE